jgi:SAM-dependent methyltransferase
MTVAPYGGRYAELHDLFYAAKPYAEEAAFVHRCLERHGDGPTGRMLELACGTGSHALALEKYGYHIVATDASEDMLACARRKAAQAASSVHFERQDFRVLAVPGSPFDAVICLFDSIGFAASDAGLAAVLEGVRAHLRPGGLFVCDFWHAPAMLRKHEPVRLARWSSPGREVLRIAETTLDRARQTATVAYTVYVLSDDGRYSKFTETQVNRYFHVQEMAGRLSAAGLQPVRWLAGFAEDERITEDTWHVLALARRV